jgi:hypothetical protein
MTDKISHRKFVKCAVAKMDIPKSHCAGCEYHVQLENKCGFCKINKKANIISERQLLEDEN